MKETVICIGQIGKKPYRFPETDVSIFSYEELCYYLSQHMLCYLYTLPEEELLFYIRDELKLEKLYRLLVKLDHPDRDQMKYFSTLFREGDYFSEEEIRIILDDYRNLKNEPYAVQCKKIGNMLLAYGKTSMAIQYYEEGMKRQLAAGTQQEMDTLYHNLGVAKARLFRFEDAKIDFLKAYQYSGNDASLFHYYGILVFTEGMAKADEEIQAFKLSDILLESFKENFANLIEEQQYTEEAAKYHKMTYLNINDRPEAAKNCFEKLVRNEQRKYRKELETKEKWVVTNVPVGYSIDKK